MQHQSVARRQFDVTMAPASSSAEATTDPVWSPSSLLGCREAGKPHPFIMLII